MKKILFFFLLILTFSCFQPALVQADYEVQISYPELQVGDENVQSPEENKSLPAYINYLYWLGLSIVALASLVSLVFAGLSYMTSGTVTSTDEAKKSIQAAILGLILALSSWLILKTINPNLVENKAPEIEEAEEQERGGAGRNF